MHDLPDYFIGISLFIFGLIIGSFLNVVIFRLPRRKSVVFPSSRCPSCETPIKPYDNIPVVSYALLGGRCRNCRAAISIIYPAVELLVATLYLAVFFKAKGLYPVASKPFWLALIAELIFVSLIVPLVFIDLEHKILPNVITYPGFLLMVLMRLLVPGPIIESLPASRFGLTHWPDWALALIASALGAAVGGGSLWLVREFYYRVRHREGMGLGDVKMMLMVGAFLGWQLTLLTIFIASLLGSIIGMLIIWRHGGTMKMEIPFGVFLGPAAVIAIFVGQKLINWYVTLYR